jgi:hypothetical protein
MGRRAGTSVGANFACLAAEQKFTMNELLAEIHPGEILLEDFMRPMGISAR